MSPDVGAVLNVVAILPRYYLMAALSISRQSVSQPWLLVPPIGLACLAIGAVVGVWVRKRALLLFLVPFLLDHVAMAIIGISAQIRGNPAAFAAVLVLLISLIALIAAAACSWAIWPAALALLIFNLTYMSFAVFMSIIFVLGPSP